LVAGGWPNRAPASDISCIVVSDISRVQANQDATVRTHLALVAKLTCVAHYSVVKEPSHTRSNARNKTPAREGETQL